MDTITISALSKVYNVKGEEAYRIRKALQRMGYIGDNVSKGSKTYKVLIEDIPTSVVEVWNIYNNTFNKTNTVDAVSNAIIDITELRDEMESWKDGMEQSEGLSSTFKYQEVSDAYDELCSAIDELECIDIEDAPALDFVSPVPCDIHLMHSRERNLSRNKRLENSIALLYGASSTLSIALDDYYESNVELADTCRELADAIDNAINILEDITFPSMM